MFFDVLGTVEVPGSELGDCRIVMGFWVVDEDCKPYERRRIKMASVMIPYLIKCNLEEKKRTECRDPVE